MEFGQIFVAPARGNFVKSDVDDVPMREFDYFEPTTMPPMFFSMVNQSFRLEDYPLLDAIIPTHSSNSSEIMKRVTTQLQLRGISFNTAPEFSDHFFVLQTLINEATGESYTMSDFSNDFDSDFFSFASEKCLKYIRTFSEKNQKPIVLLFFTEIGFFRVHDDDIDFTEADFVVVISKEEAFIPLPGKIKVLTPQNFVGERRAGFTFFPVIRFETVGGKFYPEFVNSSIAHFVTNSTNVFTRLDQLGFPFEQVSGRSTRFFGLIGRYSTIKKHLSHPNVQVAVLDFHDSSPFIGVYLSKTAYIYVFLYLPDDQPPNNPLFIEVTQWASAFMHRVCARTLFLTEPDTFTIKETNVIGGLPPSTSVRFCGSFGTSLVLHELFVNCMGSMGKDTIIFQNVDEIRMWRDYVCRRYQSSVVNGGTDASTLTVNDAVVLMNENPQKALENVMTRITGLSKADHKVRLAYWRKTHDPDNDKGRFEQACHEKMDYLTQLFNQAARWTNAAAFVAKNKCKFCDVPVEEKPGWDSEDWGCLCSKCQLEKMEEFNRHATCKKETQFLEDRVDEVKQNSEECEMLLEAFRSYFSVDGNPEFRDFAMWFFDYWIMYAFTNGKDLIESTQEIEINKEKLGEFLPNDPSFSMTTFVSEVTGYPLVGGAEYYGLIPAIFTQIPCPMEADEIRQKYLSYYLDNVVPSLLKTPENVKFQDIIASELHKMKNSGLVSSSVVDIGVITIHENRTIEMEVNWSEKNTKSGRSVTYTLYDIVDKSKDDISYVSKPAFCSRVAKLTVQPPEMFIVNAFHLDTHQVLLVTVFGSSLWLNVIPEGYDKPFLPKPLLELTVGFDTGKATNAAFAPIANILVISVQQEDGNKTIYSISLNKRHDSASIIVSRPLKHLLPVSSKEGFTSKCTGFCIRNTGQYGLLCASYCYSDGDEEYALIQFDPWTLLATGREDPFDSPFIPLFTNNMITILHSDRETHLTPKNAQVFTAPLGRKRLDQVMGIVNWRGGPRLVKDLDGGRNIFLVTNAGEPSATSYKFLPLDAAHIVASCANKYGFSEMDKVGNARYPEDAITVEAMFDLNDDAVNEYFEAGASYVSGDWKLVLIAHQTPCGDQILSQVEERPNASDPKSSMFPFFHRCAGGPRFLVNGPRPSAVTYNSEMLTSILEMSMLQRYIERPPLALLREAISKGDIMTKTISAVDIENGDGSPILSAFSGVQFVKGTPGSIRIGSVIVPTEFNKFKKFTSYFVLNALSYVPMDPNRASHCALSLLHAIACSGVVVICSSGGIGFIIRVFQLMKETIPTFMSCANFGIDFDSLRLVIVCDLGSDESAQKRRLVNDLALMSAGLPPDDAFARIVHTKITLLSNTMPSYRVAAVVEGRVDHPEHPTEQATTTVCRVSAMYGSFIDNMNLFEMQE